MQTFLNRNWNANSLLQYETYLRTEVWTTLLNVRILHKGRLRLRAYIPTIYTTQNVRLLKMSGPSDVTRQY